MTEFDLTALPPKAAPKGQQAVVAKKDAKAAPVANLRTTLRTSDGKMAQDIADAFKNNGFLWHVEDDQRTVRRGRPAIHHHRPGGSPRPGEVSPPLRVAPPATRRAGRGRCHRG